MPTGGESIQRTRTQQARKRAPEKKGLGRESGSERTQRKKAPKSKTSLPRKPAHAEQERSVQPRERGGDSPAKASGFLALAPPSVLPLPTPIFPSAVNQEASLGGLLKKGGEWLSSVTHSMGTTAETPESTSSLEKGSPSLEGAKVETVRKQEPKDSNPFRGQKIQATFATNIVYDIPVYALNKAQRDNIEEFNERLRQTQRHPHLVFDLDRAGRLRNRLFVNVSDEGETTAVGVHRLGIKTLRTYLNGIPDEKGRSSLGAANINKALFDYVRREEVDNIPYADGLSAEYNNAALGLLKAEVAEAIRGWHLVTRTGKYRWNEGPKYWVDEATLEKLRQKYNQTIPGELRLRWLASRAITDIQNLRLSEDGTTIASDGGIDVEKSYQKYIGAVWSATYKKFLKQKGLQWMPQGIMAMDGRLASKKALEEFEKEIAPFKEQFDRTNASEEDAWKKEMKFDDQNPFRSREIFWIHEDGTVIYDVPVHALSGPEKEELTRVQGILDADNSSTSSEIMGSSAEGLHALVPVDQGGKSRGMAIIKYDGADVAVAYIGGFANGDADLAGAILEFIAELGGDRAFIPLEEHQLSLFIKNWREALAKWKTWKWHTLPHVP